MDINKSRSVVECKGLLDMDKKLELVCDMHRVEGIG